MYSERRLDIEQFVVKNGIVKMIERRCSSLTGKAQRDKETKGIRYLGV